MIESAAKDYLAQGFSVIPVKGKHGWDVEDAKRPLIPWEEFQHRKATPEEVSQWFKQWPQADIAVVTGLISDRFIIDLDGEEWKQSLSEKEFPMTPVARTTRGGFHYHFKGSPRLKDYVTNRARILPGVDTRGEGGYAIVPPSRGLNGIPYAWIDGRSPQDCELAEPPAWIYDYLPRRDGSGDGKTARGTPSKTPISEILEGVAKGQRNQSLTRLAGFYLHLGMTQSQTLDHLRLVNQKCTPPLPDDELLAIVQSVDRYATNSTNSDYGNSYNSYFSYSQDGNSWPAPLAPEAYHGIAGEFVHALEPYTEADSAALLLGFLAATGNVLGVRPHIKICGDSHGLKLNAVLVGESSKSRKGSSWGPVHRALQYNDPKWADDRVVHGLTTGEGLIWAVRDPLHEKQAVKKNSRTVDYEDVITDHGVEDKRLCVVEEEFARQLHAMARQGNTLSAVIRQAWDRGRLQTLTKGNPYGATGAHISIIAHITKDELLRYFDSTEYANGFGNRFLWMAVRRSKCLPDGDPLPAPELERLQMEISRRVAVGQNLDEIKRDKAANILWREIYPTLSEGKPGLFGALVARSEVQVLRLAAIYAVLGGSTQIQEVHLRAALAVWKRAEDSVRVIFGQKTGDRIADTILAELRKGRRLSRTEIHALFHKNESADRIQKALDLLQRNGLAHPEKQGDSEVWVQGATES